VQRQAEAENERIRILAEAEQRRTVIDSEGKARAERIQAEGQAAAALTRAQAEADALKARGLGEAEALKARGMGEAEALRAKGLAEADAIKATGLAEAQALEQRVGVLNNQNQAAILDKALSNLPAIASSLYEAYGKIGSVVYVGSGDGETVTSRVGKDIVGMIPMLSAMFESTTGMNLRDLIVGQNGKGYVNGIDPDGPPPAVVPRTQEPPAVLQPVAASPFETAPEHGPNSTDDAKAQVVP
jgi:flotillin